MWVVLPPTYPAEGKRQLVRSTWLQSDAPPSPRAPSSVGRVTPCAPPRDQGMIGQSLAESSETRSSFLRSRRNRTGLRRPSGGAQSFVMADFGIRSQRAVEGVEAVHPVAPERLPAQEQSTIGRNAEAFGGIGGGRGNQQGGQPTEKEEGRSPGNHVPGKSPDTRRVEPLPTSLRLPLPKAPAHPSPTCPPRRPSSPSNPS